MRHTATGWWIEEAGAPEPCAPLTADLDADVVVIGGGFLGMWTAWHLVQRAPQTRVVLLEAERCGFGPSGRNGGFVNGYWDHVPDVAERAGVGAAVALAREADASILGIGAFCEQQGIDAWYRAAPQIEIATAPAQDGAWARDAGALARLGHSEHYRAMSSDEVQAVCQSPLFRGGARLTTAATIQPARLAFGLRRVLLDHGVHVFEQSKATGIDQRGPDSVTVSTEGGAVRARAAVLAVNWQTLNWQPFGRELSAASSHMVITEPVPDLLEEIGWTGHEPLCDCRRMLHYFRTTQDGRIAFGWGGGRMAYGARQRAQLDIDPQVAGLTEAALRRFFPGLAGRAVEHAWGGPIDVAPRRLPIYRSDGNVHAGWGFTGHGVGPSHLGGRILSALALGVHDETTALPLVEPSRKRFPPEPLRWAGGSLIRAALVRKDLRDERGLWVDPLTRGVTKLPKLLGLNLPR